MTDTLPSVPGTPKILVADATPLSLLGCIDALDWLFEPRCEVWLTDMVITEATRAPRPGGDPRTAIRRGVGDWINRNRFRIKRVETAEGKRYEREMKLWEIAGRPPDYMPDWGDRGEASLLSMMRGTKELLSAGEVILALVDDRDARDAIRAIRGNIDMMGTQTFIRWMEEDFKITEASYAWDAILLATDNKADPGEEEDPVYIRRGR